MQSLIDASNLCFSYSREGKNIDILHDLNFSVKQGEFIAIVGHNGSGKSTLAKLLNAIFVPTSGTIIVDGVCVEDGQTVFEVRKKIGMVFQNPDNQLVATLVDEDVAFALENLCVPTSEIGKTIDDTLKMVGMYESKKSVVSKLSGGQKQRVAIAGILAMKPKCIVFDESTSMLDPIGRKEVLDIMKKLNCENKTTVINITHYMEEVVLADRVIVLKDGRFLKEGTPRDIFSDKEVLNKANLSVPQVTDFFNLLCDQCNIDDKTVLDVDECVDALSDLLGG